MKQLQDSAIFYFIRGYKAVTRNSASGETLKIIKFSFYSAITASATLWTIVFPTSKLFQAQKAH